MSVVVEAPGNAYDRLNQILDARAARENHARGVEEVVADKGYHSGEPLRNLHEEGVRSYIPAPERGLRCWVGKAAARRTYKDRRQRSIARCVRWQAVVFKLIPRTPDRVLGRVPLRISSKTRTSCGAGHARVA